MPLFHDFRNSNQHLFFVHFHILFLLNMGIEVFIKKNIKKMYVLICNRPTYLQIASRFFITFFLKPSAHISWISKLKSSLFSDTFDFRKLRIMDVEFFIKKKYKKNGRIFWAWGCDRKWVSIFFKYFFLWKTRDPYFMISDTQIITLGRSRFPEMTKYGNPVDSVRSATRLWSS